MDRRWLLLCEQHAGKEPDIFRRESPVSVLLHRRVGVPRRRLVGFLHAALMIVEPEHAAPAPPHIFLVFFLSNMSLVWHAINANVPPATLVVSEGQRSFKSGLVQIVEINMQFSS